MELLTSSRIKTHARCKRKEKLRYRDRWRGVKKSDPLFFGDVIHKALEAWYGEFLAPFCDMALTAALITIGTLEIDDPIVRIKAEELLRGYDEKWSAYTDGIEILGVEEEFRIPLRNPDTMRRSRTFDFAGKLDARIRKPGGTVWIMEHKTTTEAINDPTAPYWRKLEMDHQVSGYFLGAESLAPDRADSPVGCVYDVIRRPLLRRRLATPVEKRKYRQDGKLYANQRDRDETDGEFRSRLRAEIHENLDAYFVRLDVPRSDQQLLEFMEDVWASGRLIHDGHRNGHAPRNPDACHAFGSECVFWSICAEGLDPETRPEEFQRVEFPHPELSEELQTEEA